jgi:hypothetical protein
MNLPFTGSKHCNYQSDVPVSLLRSYQSISHGPRLCLWIFRNKDTFSRWRVINPLPNPPAGGPTLVNCPRFTNAPVHEQIFRTKNVSDDERFLGLRTRKLATAANWEYRRGSQLLVNFGSVDIPAWIRRVFSWISFSDFHWFCLWICVQSTVVKFK